MSNTRSPSTVISATEPYSLVQRPATEVCDGPDDVDFPLTHWASTCSKFMFAVLSAKGPPGDSSGRAVDRLDMDQRERRSAKFPARVNARRGVQRRAMKAVDRVGGTRQRRASRETEQRKTP